MIFYTLESMLTNKILYYKDAPKKWEQLHLYRLSTNNEELLLSFKNQPNSVTEDLNYVWRTEPEIIVIDVEEDEGFVVQQICYLVIGATPRLLFSETLNYCTKLHLVYEVMVVPSFKNRSLTRTGEHENMDQKLRRLDYPKI